MTCALAQEPAKLEFDVASMRLSAPRDPSKERPYTNGRRSGGPGTSDPGRITYLRVPLDQILADAFDVIRDRIHGPDFIVTQRYDISAIVTDGSSRDQFKQMLRNLLTARLHLVAHLETKVLPGFELRTTGVLKLKETTTNPETTLQEPQPGDDVALDKDGFPSLAPGVRWGLAGAAGHTRLRFRATSMSEFAEFLGSRLGWQVVGGAMAGGMRLDPAPVLDNTGIAGRYDFTFEYAFFPITTPSLLPMVLDAIKKGLNQQLGLTVVEAKIPVSTLVIDHIERIPEDN